MLQSITVPRNLRRLYNFAPPKWHDQITALGDCDAYRAGIAALIPATTRPQRVMDVGCGAGSFVYAFVRERGRVAVLTLVDPAPDMLHEAAARLTGAAGEIEVLARAVKGLPDFPSQDLILCAHVLDHCADPFALCVPLVKPFHRAGQLC